MAYNGCQRKKWEIMVRRKKPGRKPSVRIRRHIMLDPYNDERLKKMAEQDGRTISDQLNWIIRRYDALDGSFEPRHSRLPRAEESSA